MSYKVLQPSALFDLSGQSTVDGVKVSWHDGALWRLSIQVSRFIYVD